MKQPLWIGEELTPCPTVTTGWDVQAENILVPCPGSQVKTHGSTEQKQGFSSFSQEPVRDLTVPRPCLLRVGTHLCRVSGGGGDTENHSPARKEGTVTCPGELYQTSFRNVGGGETYVKRAK